MLKTLNKIKTKKIVLDSTEYLVPEFIANDEYFQMLNYINSVEGKRFLQLGISEFDENRYKPYEYAASI